MRQLGEHRGGPQVREQIKVLAQTKQSLLRPLRARQCVIFWSANRAKQNGVRLLAQPERGLGKWIARRVVAYTAHWRMLGFQFEAVAGERRNDALGLLSDFGTNAVAGQNCNLHVGELLVDCASTGINPTARSHARA